jgi:hypothetical protein
MESLITQFSPNSCHFIHLRSKYSPQHSDLKQPESVLFPKRERLGFTPTQNKSSSVCFRFLDSRQEDKRF